MTCAYKPPDDQSLILECYPPNIPHCPDKNSGVFTFILANCKHLSINDMDMMSIIRRNEASINDDTDSHEPVYGLIRFNLIPHKHDLINIINIIRCREEHLKQFYMGQLNFAMENYNITKTLSKIPIRNIVTKLLFDNFHHFDTEQMYLDIRNNCKISKIKSQISSSGNKEIYDESEALQIAIARSYVTSYSVLHLCNS